MKAFLASLAPMLALAVLATSAAGVAAQDSYPSRPIRMIIPYPPGGTADPLARLVGQKLSEKWGQPVIAENRPGGNTIIGTQELLRAPADGYTILVTANSHVILPHVVATPYDAIKDFTPVATIASNPLILVATPSVPAKNVKELIALTKSSPVNYASSGSGTINHIAGELFDIQTGAKMTHVPYKGGSAAIADVIGGHVQVSFAMAGSVNYIKSGQLKAFAVTGTERLAAFPDLPTFAEEGLPKFDLKNWVGVMVRAGTPKAIVDKLAKEIAVILAQPDVKEKFAAQGLDPFVSTPEQFTELIKSDLALYGQVIKTANIKLE